MIVENKGNLSGLPILMYHGVEETPSAVTISPAMFQWQMEWLYQCGYQCVTLGDMVSCLASGQDLPQQTIVLTFDDGYQNLYTQAFPVLQKYNFKATVFLVASFCGKENNWPSQPASIPRMKLLTWEQIDEMACSGIEFGSHTLHHPRLDRIPSSALQEEVCESKTLLEARLDRPVNVFSYPYGRYSKQVKEIVQTVYVGACSTRVGFAKPGSDRYALERIEIQYLSQRRIFQNLFHSAFPYYLSARRTGRAIRSAFSIDT